MLARATLSLLAAAASTVYAIDVTGSTDTICSTAANRVVTVCPNLPELFCCIFPQGGLQVQSAKFSVIYTGAIAYFWSSSFVNSCGGRVRASGTGPQFDTCLSGGQLSMWGGGGANWLDLVHTTSNNGNGLDGPPIGNGVDGVSFGGSGGNHRRSVEDDARIPKCNGSVIPHVLAWEGDGVWVLEPHHETFAKYNLLPQTTDPDVHVENLKAHGAKFYEDPREHDVVAGLLDGNDS